MTCFFFPGRLVLLPLIAHILLYSTSLCTLTFEVVSSSISVQVDSILPNLNISSTLMRSAHPSSQHRLGVVRCSQSGHARWICIARRKQNGTYRWQDSNHDHHRRQYNMVSYQISSIIVLSINMIVAHGVLFVCAAFQKYTFQLGLKSYYCSQCVILLLHGTCD